MAVFSNFLFSLPGALCRRASASPARGVIGRISIYFAAPARLAPAVGELGLFLWMSLTLAFSLLVMAGIFV
jgi:hypothetical protein